MSRERIIKDLSDAVRSIDVRSDADEEVNEISVVQLEIFPFLKIVMS